ncbi:MAG TPA: alpha-hydroxy acid oxidase [Terriglobales bacterium]|jgi:4-hydroxymandelate oxidase|nr:alpha-hydroxy acid oxidase [Terriglobales bacterium]
MRVFSLRDMEVEAQRRLDPAVYDYFAGGADDEFTVVSNETAFARIGLLPRMLCGVGRAKLETTLLDCPLSMPILIGPTAFHQLAHPEGERATARAAAVAGTIMIVSMASTVAIEEVAASARQAAGGESNLWFQIYLQPDLGFTESVIQRAEASGCSALVVTVDSPTFGRRERDLRNGFSDLPSGMCCENLREPMEGKGHSKVRKIVFSPELSWKDLDWLRKVTRLKIVLKGILHPEDAKLAVCHGADAVLVSNHGGRQLDTVPATIDLLPAIVDAVNGKIPLLLDGGIRRGTDALKALALGADAVAIGRPVLWGLALGGEAGVAQVLEMLRSELDRALTLCGCGSVHDLTQDLLQFRPVEEPCISG